MLIATVALQGLDCELGGSRIEPWYLRTSGHLQGRAFWHLVPLVPFKLRIPTLDFLRARTWGPRPRGTKSNAYRRRTGARPLEEVGLVRADDVGHLNIEVNHNTPDQTYAQIHQTKLMPKMEMHLTGASSAVPKMPCPHTGDKASS